MSTYVQLQTQIATELHRSDLTTDIQTAILAAIRHYQRKLMLFSQGTHSPVIVAGTAEYSLPSDFLAFERVEITIDGDTTLLDEISSNEMAALDDDSGEPTKFSYRNYVMTLYPAPDSAYTITVKYWQQPAAPSADADSTVWTNDALDLIRHRAKADLAANTIRDNAAAQTYKVYEDETYGGMVIQRDRVLSNGRLIPTQF